MAKMDRTRPDQYACGALAYLILSGGNELPTSAVARAKGLVQAVSWEGMADALNRQEENLPKVKNALGRDLVLLLLESQPKDYRCACLRRRSTSIITVTAWASVDFGII
jgi:hypothetical protein